MHVAGFESGPPAEIALRHRAQLTHQRERVRGLGSPDPFPTSEEAGDGVGEGREGQGVRRRRGLRGLDIRRQRSGERLLEL